MVKFDYWQDALDNLQEDGVARMRKLIEKYGTDLNPEEMSVGDEFEYNLVKNYESMARNTFKR